MEAKRKRSENALAGDFFNEEQIHNINYGRPIRINPAMAQKLLDSSLGNRTIRRKKIEAYSYAMENGEWIYNGDCIRILKENGSLYDGHHRLIACITSGCQFDARIVILNHAAALTVDIGASRSSADMIHFEFGYNGQEAQTVAQIAKATIVHDHRTIKNWVTGNSGVSKQCDTSPIAISRFIAENRNRINDTLSWIKTIKKADLLLTRGTIGILHYIPCRVSDFIEVEGFLDSVFCGLGLSDGTTEYWVRQILFSARIGQTKIETARRAYTVLKGLKSVIAGRNIKHRSNVMFNWNSDVIPRFDI